MNIRSASLVIYLFLATTAQSLHAEESFALSLPVICRLGEDCFIQQYVDVDPGPGAKDYRCGSATYDGHSGTDFRVLSTKAAEMGVPVIAAAAGRVLRIRDDIPDRLMETDADRLAVADKECGNGVVISHGNGWETQYCHLKRGSLRVRAGETVGSGFQIGEVGYSGQAQFAHLHMSVRQNGKIVDPFLAKPVSGTCQTGEDGGQPSLWQGVAKVSDYTDAQFIDAGFSSSPVTPIASEKGEIAPPRSDSGVMIFYTRMINLREGDLIHIQAQGPTCFTVEKKFGPLDRNKAHYVSYGGLNKRQERWAPGVYQGSAVIIRAGQIIRKVSKQFSMP